MSAAFNTMEAAFIAKRKEWYGDLWDKVDWWGIPNRDLPQAEREAITVRLKRDPDDYIRGLEIQREQTFDDDVDGNEEES